MNIEELIANTSSAIATSKKIAEIGNQKLLAYLKANEREVFSFIDAECRRQSKINIDPFAVIPMSKWINMSMSRECANSKGAIHWQIAWMPYLRIKLDPCIVKEWGDDSIMIRWGF